MILVFVAFVAVLAVGSLVYIFSQRKSDNLRNTISQNESVVVNSSKYSNSNHNISFDYIKSWKLVERSAQNDYSIVLYPDPKTTIGRFKIDIDTAPFVGCEYCKTLTEVRQSIENILQGSVIDLRSRTLTHKGKQGVEITYSSNDNYLSKNLYILNDSKLYILSYLAPNEIASKYQSAYQSVIDSITIGN